MNDVANIIADLVRAGTDPELVGRVAAAIAGVRQVDEQAERRRAADRARKAAKKDGIPQNSAELHSEEAENKGFDKERFHTSKEITSKQTTDFRADDENAALIQRVCEVVSCIPGPLPDDATACHDAVELALKTDGLRVIREAEVRNGDGVTGRFDLLVMFAGGRVAIEIDRRQARAKSVQKLLGFDGGRIQILRGSMPAHHIAGIDAILSLPVVHGEGTRKGELTNDWQPDAKTWALADELGFTTQEAWDQLERMRDWAKNADGGKGRKSDWNAAFRNWLKRAADDRRNRPSQPRRNNIHDTLSAIDAVADEAIRLAGGYGEESSEEDTDFLPGLRESAA